MLLLLLLLFLVNNASNDLLSGDYAGFPGCGLLRLHSTYRHDLKIYASDEGRVQMTAAAFAKVRPQFLSRHSLHWKKHICAIESSVDMVDVVMTVMSRTEQ